MVFRKARMCCKVFPVYIASTDASWELVINRYYGADIYIDPLDIDILIIEHRNSKVNILLETPRISSVSSIYLPVSQPPG